ncbi:ABC transporter permease subunit [Mycoplasma sp. VS292A]|uniref:ABC transporter permease subunit n=1 Tax=unclassified Mycoplasma TaxID=2683645 RepID=UPI003AAC6271
MAEAVSKKPNKFLKATISTVDATKRFLMFDDKRQNRRKLYSSLWAVFIGLFLANILYFIIGSTTGSGVGFFSFFSDVISFASKPQVFRNTLTFFLVFAFSGLAVAIGFKSGLFNIGVPGQMLLPGVVFFTVVIMARIPLNQISTSYFIGMFLLFIVIGAITGAISGVLKAFFNVHEVISTIFINWIITFVSIWLFTSTNHMFFPEGSPDAEKWLFSPFGTRSIVINDALVNQFIYFGIAFVFLLTIIIWFIYSKTTLGYKIKMVGINRSNAQYVGINEKLVTIGIMSASGALAGIAGFYYIVIQVKKINVSPAIPLNIGFECIAIALIALNNPIGTIATSVLYAYLNSASTGFQSARGIAKDFYPVITGIIIFMAALSMMFYKFKPVDYLKKQFVLIFHKEYWQNFVIYHNLVKKSHKAKAWEKERAFLTGKWVDENKIENYQKNADYIKYIKENKTKFDHEYAAKVASVNKQIKLLESNKNKELAQALAEYKSKVAKYSDKAEIKNAQYEYYGQVSTILNKFSVDYAALYQQIHVVSYHVSKKLAKLGNKDKLKEYKTLSKQYEEKVAKLILSMKDYQPEEKMKVYDEISKLKFELLRKRDSLGLNNIVETKNAYRAEKRNRKQIYKALKSKIFDDFHLKYFKKPYEDLVLKYTPILDEEGEEI